MGRCKSLGPLKSFLSHASQLSGVSILRFFTSWVSSVLTVENGATPWLSYCRHCSSRVPSEFRNPHLEAGIADGCDSLVYWYGRKYSISHSSLKKQDWNNSSSRFPAPPPRPGAEVGRRGLTLPPTSQGGATEDVLVRDPTAHPSHQPHKGAEVGLEEKTKGCAFISKEKDKRKPKIFHRMLCESA